MIKKCLKPWINKNTKILIIGTMPGEQSLKSQSYYVHPRNVFWRYIQNILNNGEELKTDKDKQEFIYSVKIGLWDALSICERTNSADKTIKNYVPNNFLRPDFG